jgi:hypothetical protein
MALVAGAILAGAVWWFTRSHASTPANSPNLVRLTSDSGLTTEPALSPDGKLLAYPSDRSGDGNLDIYVQQLGGGAPIRLTHGPLDNSEPSFSPDGTRIAFHSDRDGGGIYVVAALGGEPRLLAEDGRRPRFSPDGSLLCYWVGEQQINTGKIFVIPSSGAASPKEFQADFPVANYPIWAPDNKHILFSGVQGGGPFLQSFDWWVASIDGGPDQDRSDYRPSRQGIQFDRTWYSRHVEPNRVKSYSRACWVIARTCGGYQSHPRPGTLPAHPSASPLVPQSTLSLPSPDRDWFSRALFPMTTFGACR